jgi:hypothetical protein
MIEDELTIRFSSRVNDLWRARWYVALHGPSIAGLIMFPLVVTVVWALALKPNGLEGLLALPIFGAYWGTALGISYFRLRRDERVVRPHEITFDPNAIVYTTADAEVRFAWSAFRNVYFRPRGLVFVYQGGRNCMWIPRDALAGPAADATIRRLISMSLPTPDPSAVQDTSAPGNTN